MPTGMSTGENCSQVSIRSHPGGWEMHSGGECSGHELRVSIRSHPGGWEMRQCSTNDINLKAGFNPLPPRRVGDALNSG